jgi:hypothetical protein
MAGKKITTAADLGRMTPAEREQSFQDSIVWDLSQVPPEVVERLRTKLWARPDRRPRPGRATGIVIHSR